MDDDLQSIRRDVVIGETGAKARLEAWQDRLEGVRPGAIQRLYDPRTWAVVAFLVDASLGPVMVSLPGDRTPGLFDPIWVKKLDPSVNPVTIRCPQGATFENGEQVWYQPIVTQFQSIGPFVLSSGIVPGGGVTWVVL